MLPNLLDHRDRRTETEARVSRKQSRSPGSDCDSSRWRKLLHDLESTRHNLKRMDVVLVQWAVTFNVILVAPYLPVTYSSFPSLFHLFATVHAHSRLTAKQALNLSVFLNASLLRACRRSDHELHATVTHELHGGITSRRRLIVRRLRRAQHSE